MAKTLDMLSKSLQENLDLTAYSQVGHTHNYAGSSTVGGAATSAIKLATAKTINGTSFDGTGNITTANWGTTRSITIGSKAKDVNGSGNVSWTLAEIGAAPTSHTHNYAGSSSAGGAANSVANNIKIQLNGGTTEGTNQFTFNGSAVKTINITPSSIGAAGSSHGTHVSYSTSAPLVAGTASAGSASNVSRGDHVHPAQTSVSGNAGTATKLATARNITIGNKTNSFDGSANISYSLADIGALPLTGGTISGGSGLTITTAGDKNKAFVVQRLVASESTKMYQDDTSFYIDMTNDETEANIKFLMSATNTESGDGTGGFTNSTVTFTGSSSGSTVTAGTFTGALNGNAKTATKAGQWTNARTLQIGNSTKTYDGTANASYSLTEIGAAPTSHTHDYLPLSGGSISSSTFGVFTINRTGSANGSSIQFKNTNGTLGYIGMTGTVNGGLQRWTADTDNSYTVLDTGNYKTIVTPASIGAAASSHGTHVTYSTTTPKVAGTAAVGSASNVSRGDHVHPAQTSVSGNAGTATKLASARTLTIGNTGKTFDGSGNVSWTVAEIGAAPTSHTHNSVASSDVLNQNTKMDYGWNGLNYFNVNGTAGNAAKVNDTPTTAWWHIIRCNHANTSGYYTDIAVPFNASSMYYKRIAGGAVQDNGWVKMLDAINYSDYAAPKSHGTHVTFGTTTPKVAGTAAVGSSSNVAREDHVHPLQTTVSGNAGTATKLATARDIKIGNQTNSFDGSGNITYTLSSIGAADATQMGVNKILFERFERGTITGNEAVIEEDLIGKSLLDATFVNDFGSYNVGDNYLGRLTTNLYFSEATEFTATANSDDGSTIYLNSTPIATLSSCQDTTVVFNFVKGWNTIVWIFNENSGSDTTRLNPSIKTASNLVYMNAFPVSASMNAKVANALRSKISDTADKLTTPRTLTIGKTGKTFDGSGNVSWSLSEIGALPISGGTVTGDTYFNYYLGINAWPNYGTGAVNMWYDGSYSDNIGALTVEKSIYTKGAIENNNVVLNAWSGYGTGYADIWYDGTNKALHIDNNVSNIKLGEKTVLDSTNYSQFIDSSLTAVASDLGSVTISNYDTIMNSINTNLNNLN